MLLFACTLTTVDPTREEQTYAADGSSNDNAASSSSSGYSSSYYDAQSYEEPETYSFGGGGGGANSGGPPAPTPLERIMADPLSAAIMGPRLALGGATQALDLLQKGELFGAASALAAAAPAEVSMLLQDPRPLRDKAMGLLRRAEEVAEKLEERGIAAETPGRELVKPIIPAPLYDRYLDPDAVRPWSSSSPTSNEAYGAPAGTYASYGAGAASANTSTSTASSSYSYNAAAAGNEDPAVAAAAAAVAAALRGDVAGGGSSTRTPPPPPPSTPPPPQSPASSMPSFEVPPVPQDVWGAVSSAEAFAADIVMTQSTVTATATKAAAATSASTSYPSPPPPSTVPPPPPPPTTPPPASVAAAAPAATAAGDEWAASAEMTGRWRKEVERCSDEGPLFDAMEMSWIFRQAAMLLNEVTIGSGSDGWSVASSASFIALKELYPRDGRAASQMRRDLRSGGCSGTLEAVEGGVHLVLTWRGELSGSQDEVFTLEDGGVTLKRVVNLTLGNGRTWQGIYHYVRA